MKPVLTILLVSLACLCAGAVDDDDDFDFTFGRNYEKTPLGVAIDKATLKVLKEAYDGDTEKNVITSPMGVMLLLSLFSAAAGPGTREEIAAMLGGGDYRQLTDSYSSLSNIFAEMDPSYLTLANKVCVSDKHKLADEFANIARNYRSEVDQLDFTKPVEAAKIINAWSENKTRGHIKEPVSPDILTPDTVAALFNVIFFQGHWHVPFDAKDTADKDFHVDKTTTVKKPTMKLLQSLYYTESEELGAKMIELPYKEKGFRMVVVLPNEIDGLPSVLEKASQKGLLDDVFKLSPAGADVDLEIPKFEIKSKLDFNKILPNIGVSKIFSEPSTELLKDTPVVVSKVFQEAFVKVDEEGATAGAFTGVVIMLASSDATPPPPIKFAVDRPFLFAILHNDKALFAGTYSH